MIKLDLFKKAKEVTKPTGIIKGEFTGLELFDFKVVEEKQEYSAPGTGRIVPGEFSETVKPFIKK